MDGSKQEAMDLLLLGTAVTSELHDRASLLLPIHMMQGKKELKTVSCVFSIASGDTVVTGKKAFCTFLDVVKSSPCICNL